MTTYERLRETHGNGRFNTGKQRSMTKKMGWPKSRDREEKLIVMFFSSYTEREPTGF
jgi:hypothetical protein